MVPFVIAAGALQYSQKKFLVAMTLGRLVRYCILAYLGAVYGRKIFAVVLAHGEVALYVTIGVVVAGDGDNVVDAIQAEEGSAGGGRLADEWGWRGTNRLRVELVDWCEPNVLIYVGCERGSGGDVNILAVFDEADRTEQDCQRHGRSGFAVSFSSFGAANPHVVAAGDQILHLNAEFSWSSHHARLFGVGDGGYGVRAFRDDDRTSHF